MIVLLHIFWWFQQWNNFKNDWYLMTLLAYENNVPFLAHHVEYKTIRRLSRCVYVGRSWESRSRSCTVGDWHSSRRACSWTPTRWCYATSTTCFSARSCQRRLMLAGRTASTLASSSSCETIFYSGPYIIITAWACYMVDYHCTIFNCCKNCYRFIRTSPAISSVQFSSVRIFV